MPRLPYTNFHDLNLNWFIKEFKKIIASVAGKQDKPAQAGTPGQVLGLNDGLQPVWVNQEAGGTTDYTELDNKPKINGVELSGNKTGSEYELIDTPATPGTAGQVLGLDESLTPKWIDQEGGSFDFDITGTASGAIASFDDGANNEPLQDLLIAIEPAQAGSGDPSPSNIRPISGWAGVTITRCRKNLWNQQVINGDQIINGLKAGETYTVTADATDNSSYCYVRSRTGTDAFYLLGRIVTGGTKQAVTFTAEAGRDYSIWSNSSYTNIKNVQIEHSSYASSYEPYQGTTYPITFDSAGTVYGGVVNPVTGTLSITYGLISSYNGETLPSKWLSDRDVYAAGTTPSIGAQVVYELATPITYTISASEIIRTLLGFNNIFANTGDILQCVYKVDPDIYLRNIAKVKILTPEENTIVLKPFPVTYNFGERTALTLTATADTYYKFMFKCPANAVTNITINGAPDTAGDIPAAGKTYIVEIWAGIANYTELAVAVG